MRSTPESVSKPDLVCAPIQTVPGSLYSMLALLPLEVIGLATLTEPRPQAVQKWGHVETGRTGGEETHKEVTEAPDERQAGRQGAIWSRVTEDVQR